MSFVPIYNLRSTSNEQWLDRGSYWEHVAEQGTDQWLQARIGRITGSVAGALIGRSNFKSAMETGLIIAGAKVEKFSEKSITVMQHGTDTEPIARDWYMATNKCKVVERGLCVPKWDMEIGTSVDGDIIGTDGIIEIKCPMKMYSPVKQYMNQVASGWQPPQNFYNHIWSTHFIQMQHSMYVLGKKWCDYIVYCSPENTVFTQRIPFNPDYWNNTLYPMLKKNYNLYVKTNIVNNNYPLCPKYI